MAQPRTIQNSMLMGICIGAFGGGLYAYMMLTGIGDFIDCLLYTSDAADE